MDCNSVQEECNGKRTQMSEDIGAIQVSYSSPVTGLELPRGFQEVKAPRFHDNGTGCW